MATPVFPLCADPGGRRHVYEELDCFGPIVGYRASTTSTSPNASSSASGRGAQIAAIKSAATKGGAHPDCIAESTRFGVEAKLSSQRIASSAASSLTNGVVLAKDRRVGIRVARKSFPAGPGSSPDAVSGTASHNALSWLLRLTILAATVADLRAR